MTVERAVEAGASAEGNLRAGENRQHQRRQVPADFAERAAELGPYQLRLHYKTKPEMVRRWAEEAGVTLTRCHAVIGEAAPADFRQMAAKMHRTALCAHYGRKMSVIKRWVAEEGVTPAKPPLVGRAAAKPMPEGFATIAPKFSVPQLARRFNAGTATVLRWCAIAGVTASATPNVAKGPARLIALVPPIADTLAARAAQHLRRRHVVYNCAVLTREERAKLPNDGRGLWYVNGKGAIPATQMIALAKARGFKPAAGAHA
jgi:hypothetical protein